MKSTVGLIGAVAYVFTFVQALAADEASTKHKTNFNVISSSSTEFEPARENNSSTSSSNSFAGTIQTRAGKQTPPNFMVARGAFQSFSAARGVRKQGLASVSKQSEKPTTLEASLVPAFGSRGFSGFFKFGTTNSSRGAVTDPTKYGLKSFPPSVSTIFPGSSIRTTLPPIMTPKSLTSVSSELFHFTNGVHELRSTPKITPTLSTTTGLPTLNRETVDLLEGTRQSFVDLGNAHAKTEEGKKSPLTAGDLFQYGKSAGSFPGGANSTETADGTHNLGIATTYTEARSLTAAQVTARYDFLRDLDSEQLRKLKMTELDRVTLLATLNSANEVNRREAANQIQKTFARSGTMATEDQQRLETLQRREIAGDKGATNERLSMLAGLMRARAGELQSHLMNNADASGLTGLQNSDALKAYDTRAATRNARLNESFPVTDDKAGFKWDPKDAKLADRQATERGWTSPANFQAFAQDMLRTANNKHGVEGVTISDARAKEIRMNTLRNLMPFGKPGTDGSMELVVKKEDGTHTSISLDPTKPNEDTFKAIEAHLESGSLVDPTKLKPETSIAKMKLDGGKLVAEPVAKPVDPTPKPKEKEA